MSENIFSSPSARTNGMKNPQNNPQLRVSVKTYLVGQFVSHKLSRGVLFMTYFDALFTHTYYWTAFSDQQPEQQRP